MVWRRRGGRLEEVTSLLEFLTSFPYHFGMTATITSKGQITIPAKIREKLRLKPGQVLKFDETTPFLKAQRVFDEGRARAVLGCAKDAMRGLTAEKWLSQTRGRAVRLRK